MSEKVISKSIVINRPRQIVWQYVSTSENWKKWYVDDLVDVTPGWQEGAILVFRSGRKNTIEECVPSELLRWGEGTFLRLVDADSSSTQLELGVVAKGMLVEDPLLLAEFEAGYEDDVEDILGKLKVLLETDVV